MAYLGNSLTVQQYAPQIAYFNGTGSQTAFTLPVAVVSAAQIIVAVENVIQNPSSAFGVSGTTLTFTSAPPSGTSNIWVEYTSLTTAVSSPPPGYSEFASGTALTFNQTSAPTGWTKLTTNDNAALRVVSGSVSTGGSVDFTTAFASQTPAGTVSTLITNVSGTIGNTTLTTSQIPSHTHTFSGQTGGQSANHTHNTYDWGNNVGGLFVQNSAGGYYYNAASNFASGTVSSDHSHGYSGTTSGTGDGGSHNHTFTFTSAIVSSGFTGTAINLAVKYVDVIIATKN
jgi:hypothetical protein